MDHQCVTQCFSSPDDSTGGTASAGWPPMQTQWCGTGNCTGTGTGTGTGSGTGAATRSPTHAA